MQRIRRSVRNPAAAARTLAAWVVRRSAASWVVRRSAAQWLATAAGLALAAAGCNTDAMFRAPKAPAGAMTPHSSAAGLDAADAREVDLVESLVTEREAYYQALADLHQTFTAQGRLDKAQQVEFERQGLEQGQVFQYLMDAEVPPAGLRPSESNPQADRLFQEARELMKKGGSGVPVFYRQNLMVLALKKLQSLIRRYPASDKIDDAAFYCGEIHKEYLKDQELIAVRWYERAWQWDPATPHAPRFQAAVVYDYRLHDRAKALELYHQVVENETADITNVRFATRRIGELTRQPSPVRGQAIRPGPDLPPNERPITSGR